jgi:hypothetical protein
LLANTGDLYVRNTADDKDIIFKADAGGTEAEIMRIDGSTGRVGIGATSPDSALELEVASAGSTQTRCFHIDHNPTGNSGSGYMTIRSGTNTGASASLEQVSSGGGSLYGTYSDTNLINHGTQTSGAYNNINFVTNEAIRMTVGGGTQAGNIGIGTTSPSATLHVVPSDTYGGITVKGNVVPRIVFNSTNGGTNHWGVGVHDNNGNAFAIGHNSSGHASMDDYVVVKSGGYVGIGTNSPATKLQIDEYTVGSNGNQSVTGTASIFTNSGSDGLYLGVKNASYPNRGYAFKVTNNGVNSDFTIREHGSTGDRFTIQTGGNVGIGTTSPATKLVIDNGGVGTVDSGYSLAILGDGIDGVQIISSSSYQGRIVFGDNSSNAIGRLNYDHSNDSMSFVTNGSEKMRITSGGNVGIGTTSPSEELHVSGNARIGSSATNGHLIGRKDYSVTQTFSTGLTVELGNHKACHVKVFISGDWSNHSSIAYVGEFFIQNGGDGYNEPGIILTEHDNLPTDGILSKIVDGTSDSFEIQFRANTSSATSVSGRLCYHVMGDATSVS